MQGGSLSALLRLALAVLHLLALGERPLDSSAVRRALTADAWWGIAALLWIVTGLWRLLAGTEKARSYYLHNHVFLAKMTFLALVLALEVWPMITLIRWRAVAGRVGRGWQPDARSVARIRGISYVEAALVIAMVATAAAMARGYGYRAPGPSAAGAAAR